MEKRTVLKVDVSCQKCKQKLFKAVSGLQGVDRIEVDAAKGTMTVTGNADPIEIIVRTRKAGKYADVVSIGPPPPPPKAAADAGGGRQKQKAAADREEKRQRETQPSQSQEKPLMVHHLPSTCPVCQQLAFHEPYVSCTVI